MSKAIHTTSAANTLGLYVRGVEGCSELEEGAICDWI